MTGIALAILLAALAATSESTAAEPVRAVEQSPLATAAPELMVDPSNFWTTSGNATQLTAGWTAAASGCAVDPLWYRWSVPDTAGVGFLVGVDGPNTTFWAEAQRSTTASISVVAAAGVSCGGSTTAVVRTASATVRVDAPLAVRDVTVFPNPLPANSTAWIDGTIVGGEGPYYVSVSWGEGLHSIAIVASVGPFSIEQVLPSGRFAPIVALTDAVGTQVTTPAVASVTATRGFAIGIVPSGPVVDVAAPLRIVVVTSDPNQTLALSIDCGNGDDGIPSSDGRFDSFVCVYGAPGPEIVSARAVLQGVTPCQNVTATLTEMVVADPTLTPFLIPTSAEVGDPFSANVFLFGGEPPYTVDWRVVGSDANLTETVDFDGWLPLATDPPVAGSETVEVGATDATGAATGLISIYVPVATPLRVTAAASGTVVSGTPVLELGAGIFGGAPPYDWAVDSPEGSSSGVGGRLGAPGPLAWNGTGIGEGTLTAELFVIDAAGIAETRNVSATPILPLTAGPPSVGIDGGNWTLTLPLSGGIPPYRVWANASDGFVWNASNVTPGSFELSAPLPTSEPLSIAIVVVDALGGSVRTNVSIPLQEPSRIEGPFHLGVAVLAGSVLGVTALSIGVAWRHRRQRQDPAPMATPVDAEGVLRRLIEPVDGADRATVELLAAEEGVSPSEASRTLDRLIARGQVRAGRGADGEEILAWETPL